MLLASRIVSDGSNVMTGESRFPPDTAETN
jgi:hypothetical protein